MANTLTLSVADLSFLAEDPYPAAALAVGGALSLFIAAYGRRDDSYIDEIGTAFAMVLGLGILVIAIVAALEKTLSWFSLVLLFLLVSCLFLKPLKNIPWAAVFGIIAGAAAAYLASLVLPAEVFGVEEWKVLVGIFLVVGFVVHLLTHFVEGLLTISTMIISWRSSMVLVGILAMSEGLMLYIEGRSLISFL